MLNVWPEVKSLPGQIIRSSRQSDWKDEAVLIILSLPVLVLAYAVISDDPTAMDKVKLFFRDVLAASVMVHKFVDPCRGVDLWYKGYTDFLETEEKNNGTFKLRKKRKKIWSNY